MAECCSGGVRLIYPCSGAADVGEISDRVARKLRDEGFAQMTCLAGVGANLSGFVMSAKGADLNITIDGCPTACAKKAIERVGAMAQSYILTDFGIEKGKTPPTDAVVENMCAAIKEASWTPQKERTETGAGNCSCGGEC
ncbi:MAG TPA: putative zinc-binding protein [Spirochaetota bacterium]|nr:putative zinc-binding protein [Spirochaetota bacterium]HNT12861.1 putative zinc-binding protein [Spirochaetota bacterium]